MDVGAIIGTNNCQQHCLQAPSCTRSGSNTCDRPSAFSPSTLTPYPYAIDGSNRVKVTIRPPRPCGAGHGGESRQCDGEARAAGVPLCEVLDARRGRNSLPEDGEGDCPTRRSSVWLVRCSLSLR